MKLPRVRFVAPLSADRPSRCSFAVSSPKKATRGRDSGASERVIRVAIVEDASTVARGRCNDFGRSFVESFGEKWPTVRTADICPRIYRDNTALGQRVWPRQIDSASSLLRATLRYRQRYGRFPAHGFSFIFRLPFASALDKYTER